MQWLDLQSESTQTPPRSALIRHQVSSSPESLVLCLEQQLPERVALGKGVVDDINQPISILYATQ